MTETLGKFIGQRVKEIRISNKISQEQLAEQADLGHKYLSYLENGKYNIKIDTLEKLLEALELSPSEFFDTKLDSKLISLINKLNSLSPDLREQLINSFYNIVSQFDSNSK